MSTPSHRSSAGGYLTFRSENSIVDATSSKGIDGNVSVNSPETNISGSIVALPETFINASEHLSKRCAAPSANVSSFVVKDRSTIRPGPEDAASSTFFEDDAYQRFPSNQLVATNADQFISSVHHDHKIGFTLAQFGCGE